MAQYVINTGAFPNDGTGDPLRTAFEEVNLNFNQVFAAGPVLSNIEIINNTIYTTNTNGNLILNPNGIGSVIANAHVIPDTNRIRNLGSQELKWDTVYAYYFVGDGNGISNVTATKISNGTTSVDAYYNSNVTVTIGGLANVAVFSNTGIGVLGNVTVSGNVNAGQVVTNSLSGNSVTITATGLNQGISLLPNGTGNINVNLRNINNLAAPVAPYDAATKYYVDTVAQGLDIKASVQLATAAGLPAYTYNNGASGIGATITGNAVGTLSIDYTAVTANARVLVKNETASNSPYNGIYVVTETGNATAAYQLTRSTDFDNGAPSGEIPGAFTFVEEGSTNADSGWVCTTNNPVTVGTTPIIWAQFSGAGSYLPGNGLSLDGGVFNVNVDNLTTEINGSNQVAVKANAVLISPNIGNATGTSLSLTGNITAGNVNSLGVLSAVGNVNGGNLLTNGVVSATGNVTGGNVLSSGYVSATSHVIAGANVSGLNINTTGRVSAGGNVIGTNVSAIANVVAGNVTTVGNVTADGTGTFGNLSTTGTVTAGIVTATGNITGNNLYSNNTIEATGNVIGGNIKTVGQVSATGNVVGGNVTTIGIISANGNVAGGNLTTTGQVSATGNITTDGYFFGNGSQLTGVITSVANINNGTTNVSIETANANITMAVNGTSNVVVISTTGEYVTGEVSVSGNITGANILTDGKVSANIITVNTISSGNTLTISTVGNINVSNTHITNLANPVNLQDAATKYYVDTVATGLNPKASVSYATTAPLGVPYFYNNGTSGVGATLTATVYGNLTIDGNVVQSGQRVLIKNEVGSYSSPSLPSAAFNGIYVVDVVGNGSTYWQLTRATDFDINTEMPSSFTFVEEGANNADTGWVCTTNNPIVVGTTQITFVQFSGAGTYLAGNGLSLSGSTFNVNVDNNTTEINGSNQVVVKDSANLVTPNIGNATGTSLSVTGNITAPYFIGNVVGNITGNLNVNGENTQVLFNDSGLANATAGFTFDKTSNAVVVTGNITGGNLVSNGIVSATSGVYGDIYTTSIDSGDSSAILVTPDLILLATLDVNQDVNINNQLSVTGDIIGGNIFTNGNVNAGNVNTENILGNEVIITASVDGISLLSAGNINVGNTYINDLRDPAQAQDAATKFYVDSVAQGLDIKGSVGLSTSTTLPAYTYNNGNVGVGATLTGTANGTLSIDSTAITVTERVLIKNETAGNAPYNGIYVVTQTGNSTAPYILTRSTDMNEPGEFPSAFTFVEYGNTNADTGWVCTTNGPITIGTTPITWTQFSGGGTITAGNGVAIVGTSVNVLTDGITTSINGSNQVEVKPNAQLTTPNIGNATGASLSVTGNIQTNDILGSNVTITSTGSVQNITLNPTGNVDVSSSYINNVTDPLQPQDAATKYYVDTVAGGVTANVLGNLINMGSNTQGQLISNAVTLTTTTKVTDGIALLNQVLGKLVPPAPPAFPASQSITISGAGTYRMANITQVNNTANSLTVAAGATVTNVLRAATYATNTITTAGPGDSGTITLYRNGTGVGNTTFNPAATPTANGTYGGNLVISNNYDYRVANANIAAGFWYVFSAGISGSSAPAGWNDVIIVDTAAGNTNVASWYYDNSSPSTPSYSSTTMTPPGSTTLLYSSTIPHYTNVNQFTIGTTVANISGNLYPTSNTMASGTAAGSFAAPTSVTYAQSNIGSNVIGSFATASFTTTANITTGFGGSLTGPSIAVNNSYSTGTLTLTTALGNTVLYKSGTAVAVDEGNIVITTLGTGSGNAVRIVNPGSGNTPVYTGSEANFNSQSSTLQTYDATVVGSGSQGVLKHDQTNYSTGYLPAGPDLSTGRSGTQYFTFKFVRTDVSKFDITYAGNVAGMWVALPGSVIDSSSGANGWINMATAYAGAGYPGVNAPGNGSDGCAVGGTVSLNTTVASTSKTCTFGTVSSSSTATNEIYVRIALTSGQSVTGLSLKAASN